MFDDEESTLVYDTARRFAENELRPLEAVPHTSESLTRDALTKLAAAGLLGGVFPESYGGGGISYKSYARLCEAVCSISPTIFTSLLTVQLSLVSTALLDYGTEEQKDTYLRAILAGEKLAAIALTEPETGSDLANMRTAATRAEGGWLLNGTKYWISNGTIADVILVFAQTDPGSRHRGLAAFIVEADDAGLTRHPVPEKFGLHYSDTAAIYFENLFVPEERVVGGIGDGFRIAQNSLERGRVSTAAGAVGIGQACLEAVTSYAKERQQWGKPIAGHQLVQEGVAKMATAVSAARLLTLKAADDLDNGRPSRESVAMAKYFATDMAVTAARDSIALHGGVGYLKDMRVSGLLADALGLSLYEGTTQMQLLMIGREVLGVSAFG